MLMRLLALSVCVLLCAGCSDAAKAKAEAEAARAAQARAEAELARLRAEAERAPVPPRQDTVEKPDKILLDPDKSADRPENELRTDKARTIEPPVKPKVELPATVDLAAPRGEEHAADKPVPAPLENEKIPTLFLKLQHNAKNNSAVGAAALSHPYVYLLAADGKLWIFKLPTKEEEKPNQELAEVGWLDTGGDGLGLTILGDTLLCTFKGGLKAFSLENPIHPRFLEYVGPPQTTKAHSEALVTYKNHIIVIGTKNFFVFNVSNPARPRYLGSTPHQSYKWSGCVLGELLFVAESEHPGSRPHVRNAIRNGISVFDLKNPTRLTERAFVATKKAPYSLLPVGSDRFVSLARDSAQLFRVADGKPTPVGEPIAVSGGRAGAILTVEKQMYLITASQVIRIEDKGLTFINRYRKEADYAGFPYRADVQGQYAIIPGGLGAVALRPESRLAAPARK